jgi:ribonuclease D
VIDTPDQLRALIARARDARRVALDTEFVWERTYYARLGLVQLGLSRDEVFLIDTVALDDLSPLAALLEDADVVKILHDAQQDLMILHRATGGAPKNVFDSRLAAGFVGLGATNSLQALVEETVGVHLPKGESRSDWLRRPLRDKQLDYARDDVRYLPDAYDVLRERIDALDRAAWVREEMAQYDDLSLYTDDDARERFHKVKGRGKRGFSGRDYAVLREVTAWREETARRRDRPRGHIVKDDVLVALAQRKPADIGDLGSIRGLSDNARRSYGEDIVDAVQRGLDVPKSERPKRVHRRRLDDAEQARLDLAQALIKGRSLSHSIDPGLIGNRKDVERLVADGPDADAADHAMLRGWRGAFIGDALLDLLRGQSAVAVDAASDLPRLAPSNGAADGAGA